MKDNLKWKRIGKDAWVEIDEPEIGGSVYYPTDQHFYDAHDDWFNRAHHPIHDLESGWWKDGEVKELDKDFIIVGDDDGGRLIEPKKIIIPLKPRPMKEEWSKEPHFAGTKEMKEERKFTLDEILLYGVRCAVLGRGMNPQKYFKEKFNIDL